jgi:hypothetical protein
LLKIRAIVLNFFGAMGIRWPKEKLFFEMISTVIWISKEAPMIDGSMPNYWGFQLFSSQTIFLRGLESSELIRKKNTILLPRLYKNILE